MRLLISLYCIKVVTFTALRLRTLLVYIIQCLTIYGMWKIPTMATLRVIILFTNQLWSCTQLELAIKPAFVEEQSSK